MIYVGDTVTVDFFIDIGMSHREPWSGSAIVTAVHPQVRVRPVGWTHDRPVRWSDIRPRETDGFTTVE